MHIKAVPLTLRPVVEWLASWTSDLEVGGSSLVIAVVLFP